MALEDDRESGSRGLLWTGRVMSWLPGLLLLVDGVMKIVKPEAVVKATVEVGIPESVILPVGVALAVSAVLYLIPRTAVLGAILLTGYLGGAVETHVRLEDGPVQMLIPVLFAVLLWGGLVLRNQRVRSLLPLVR
jgi:hypothetical protein